MNQEEQKFLAILDSFTNSIKKLDPFYAPYFNIPEDFGKFGDYASPEYFKRRNNLYLKTLESLETISAKDLSPARQRTFQLLLEDVQNQVQGFQYPQELLAFNQMENRLRAFIDDTNSDLSFFPFETTENYEQFLSRMSGLSTYVDNQISLLKRGIRERITLNCMSAQRTINTFQEGMIAPADKNPFYRPVLHMPEHFSKQEKAKIERDFQNAISQNIIPNYKRFDHFFQKEYLPHCRKEYGIGKLNHGKAWYQYTIKQATGLDMKAREIHRIGLAEVKRILSEKQKVINSLVEKGHLSEGQTIKDEYFQTASEILEKFKGVKSSIEAKIPQFFEEVPTLGYEVVESGNPEDAAASYRPPSELSPQGRFVINTKNLKANPKQEVTTLSMHEAIPGHHFQLALAFEKQGELTEYERKMFSSNSFIEGWALYAESLGSEMGLYDDPYQYWGHLNAEMLRAVRLVVDTAIHELGWSREKVIEYMHANLSADLKDLEAEADRYSVWPGQAVSYKLGQIHISQLRSKAQKQLGPRFDIRKFHQAVLGSGTVSLQVLDQQVQKWIDQAKN